MKFVQGTNKQKNYKDLKKVYYMPDEIYRIVIKEGSEEEENLQKIQEITGIKDMKQIILACINIAYERYYKNLIIA